MCTGKTSLFKTHFLNQQLNIEVLYYKLKCDFVFYEDHLKTLRPNHEGTINSYFEKLQETDGVKAHR